MDHHKHRAPSRVEARGGLALSLGGERTAPCVLPAGNAGAAGTPDGVPARDVRALLPDLRAAAFPRLEMAGGGGAGGADLPRREEAASLPHGLRLREHPLPPPRGMTRPVLFTGD